MVANVSEERDEAEIGLIEVLAVVGLLRTFADVFYTGIEVVLALGYILGAACACKAC